MAENIDPKGGEGTAAEQPKGAESSAGEQGNKIQQLAALSVESTVRYGLPVFAAIVATLFVMIIGSIFLPYVPIIGSAKDTLLREIADTNVARGLITFLVAVSTVGIAIILTVYAIVNPAKDLKENFGMAKEVLSGLIGVLGTIVGFYFGSTIKELPPNTSSPSAIVSAVKVATLRLDPTVAKPGDEFKIIAEVSGGKPPYDYTISFNPKSISNDVTKKGSAGNIAEKVTVPQGLSPGTSFEVAITAKDQAGTSVSSEKPVTFKVGP